MTKHGMMSKFLFFAVVVTSILFFNGCTALKGAEAKEPDYKEMKQMVVDILQTEDGKKAIQEAVQDPTLKKKMILSDTDVEKIVQTEFLSAENKQELKKMFEDPKFASELGKTLKKENEKLLKDLMKDPEYRKMMIETMKDQEFEKMLLDVMKSSAYRKQTMLIMKESLESPMFQDDLLKLMEKANEEALKPEKEGKKEGEKGGEKESGQ